MSIKFSFSAAASAVAVLALSAAPADAQNRGRQQAPAPVDPAVVMAEAQTAATAAGLACQVVEANRLGATPAGTAFEVACGVGPGFLVVAGETPQAYNCLGLAASASDQTSARCNLPRNADAIAAVRSYVESANLSCNIDQAAWIGQLPSGEDRYEVGCAGSEGYWIDVAKASTTPGEVIPCLEIGGSRTCQFTTKDEQVAWIAAKYGASLPAGCTPTDLRVAGQNPQAKFYEVKCSDNSGYFLRTLVADGSFDRAIPCADALSIGGGCTLVDTSAAVAAATNARSAALAAVYPDCQAGEAQLIGREQGATQREVVEFRCAGKPIGVVGFLGAADPADNEALDCITATIRNLECRMTTAAQIKTALQAQMDAGNMPCVIRSFMVHARTDDLRGDFTEIKCEDDRSLFGQFPHDRSRAAADVMICARARLLYGFECEL
jgi:hypothetical protein